MFFKYRNRDVDPAPIIVAAMSNRSNPPVDSWRNSYRITPTVAEMIFLYGSSISFLKYKRIVFINEYPIGTDNRLGKKSAKWQSFICL